MDTAPDLSCDRLRARWLGWCSPRVVLVGLLLAITTTGLVLLPRAPMDTPVVCDACASCQPYMERIAFLEWKLSLLRARSFHGVPGPMDQKCLQPSTLWEFGIGAKPAAAAGGTYPSQTGEAIFAMLRFNDTHPVWSARMWEWYRERLRVQQTVSVPDYPHSAEDLLLAYSVAPDSVRGATTAVFSAITPWTESTLHHFGARQIVCVDYNVPMVEGGVPILPRSFAELYASNEIVQFDSIASFSGVEHDGNGRYGDPLNPTGDLSALKEMWHFLKPNGILFLGVPLDAGDRNVFPWHRLYGPGRLARLIAPYRLLAYAWDGKVYHAENGQFPPGMFQRPAGVQDWQYQPVLVLQKNPRGLEMQ